MIWICTDPDDPDHTVIESYTFKFTYSTYCGVEIFRNGRRVTETHGMEQTKKETTRMLRNLILLTQNLEPLPSNAVLTMKILYYDGVTPADYEPPGFKRANSDSCLFEDGYVNIKLADISTPFHEVNMRVRTNKKQFKLDDQNAGELSSDGQLISNSGLDSEHEGLSQQQGIEDEQEDMETASIANPENEAAVPETIPAKPESEAAKYGDQEFSEQEYTVQCACGNNNDDGLMIMCNMCLRWQHAMCFGILTEEDAPDIHVCDVCAKGDPAMSSTDPYLTELNAIEVQKICIWRKTLFVLMEFDRLLPSELAERLGVENSMAQDLVKRLEKEGFLCKPKDRRRGKVVLKDKTVREGFPTYFLPPKKTYEHDNKENDMQTKDDTTARSGTRQESETVKENFGMSSGLEPPAANTSHVQLTDVTEKTANLSLRRSPAERTCEMTELKKRNQTKKTNENVNKKQAVKRAYSKVDQTEFEMSSSQETEVSHSIRRKKCSDVQQNLRL